MRNVLILLIGLAISGSAAFWAYHENYKTKAALDEMGKVRRDIALLRETLGVQRAEWAYLNSPDRLRELVNLNFDRLGLMPFESNQFAEVAQVAYPAPPAAPETAPETETNPEETAP